MDECQKQQRKIVSGQEIVFVETSEKFRALAAEQQEDNVQVENLVGRGKRLLDSFGLAEAVVAGSPRLLDEEPDVTGTASERPLPSWEELVTQYSEEHLLVCSYDDLLPPEVVADIERQLEAPVAREPWVKWDDFLAVGAAGIAGALFDLLLNNNLFLRPDIHGRIPHSKHAIDFPFQGGSKHRVIGGGHDLFRFAEARQMLIDGAWQAKFRGGHVFADAYRYGGHDFPYDAIPEEAATNALLLHWVADFFSTRSLPIPGWSYLSENSDRLTDFALHSYEAGLNLRSVMSNISGVLLTGLMLRLYVYIQQYGHERKVDWMLWKNVKFHEMCLAAQSINLLVNLGKVAITKNVYAINVPAIIAVIRHTIPVIGDIRRRKSPIAIMDRNRLILDHGWEELEKNAYRTAGELQPLQRLRSDPTLVV